MMNNMKSSDYTLFWNVVRSQKKTLILSLSLPGVSGELRVKNHALLPICKIGYVSFKRHSSLTEIPNPILSHLITDMSVSAHIFRHAKQNCIH